MNDLPCRRLGIVRAVLPSAFVRPAFWESIPAPLILLRRPERRGHLTWFTATSAAPSLSRHLTESCTSSSSWTITRTPWIFSSLRLVTRCSRPSRSLLPKWELQLGKKLKDAYALTTLGSICRVLSRLISIVMAFNANSVLLTLISRTGGRNVLFAPSRVGFDPCSPRLGPPGPCGVKRHSRARISSCRLRRGRCLAR